MNIPDIGFNHQQSDEEELEVIDLASIYQRANIDHNPQLPHKVNFFMLIYVEQGEGVHMIDFNDYSFSAGSVLLVQREQVHAFDFSAKPQGKVLIFTQAFLDQVHANMRLPKYTPTHLNQQHSPQFNLDQPTCQRANLLIEQITLEVNHPQTDPLVIMYLFSALALILHRVRPEAKHDKMSLDQNVKLARFFELMQQHFRKTRDASWYANQVNTTYKTLNHICKLATGLTAKQMIDAFTVIEIKRHIVISKKPSQQIAYDFGFDDASNFVKYFKNQTNITPSQFLKQVS
ncbi:AraC family transcriptional regulator [Shewanella sp. 10N.286.51.B7]|uniref:AraC family transcriptional regulator n=1 Tax=Shewanella sp. 10N.286.51.B7 TaxID=1880836 RepID=UPI000C83DBD2|nr:helix-turn-helix transcriptional regulator [Shewanella sp. 10N.286.51.B7]PMG74920.1 AraC family transcriptional regulator [Shewanella sp. 10N.286.51.B7]